jgi:hypothetical protein
MKIKLDFYYRAFDTVFEYGYTLKPNREIDYVKNFDNMASCYYYLIDEIYEWLIDLNIPYKVGFHDAAYSITDLNSYWYIEIEDNNKAMLYKLPWGGK